MRSYADVDSGVESQAFAQFTPAMAGCVKPGGTIKLTKALVCGLAPEALYRLALAARSMPALDQKIAR